MFRYRVIMMDYTLDKYRALCHTIDASSYRCLTVEQCVTMKEVQLDQNYIILRHDVDRFPVQAQALALIEHENNIKGSYYFRIPASWHPDIIQYVSGLGHEVGLHYECLDKAGGDLDKAGEILDKELTSFRSLASVKTISMHGNPATKFDNRALWSYFNLSQFDLVGEVYLSMDFEKVLYYSDTGRTWEDGKFNIKDIIPADMKSVGDKPTITTTDDLIQLIQNETRNLYILVHPERWRGSVGGWLFSAASDHIINYLKIIIKYAYRLRHKLT